MKICLNCKGKIYHKDRFHQHHKDSLMLKPTYYCEKCYQLLNHPEPLSIKEMLK